VLYSPLVEHAAPLGRELLDMRDAFLSKLAYQTYNGYVMSQFKKLAQDIRNRGEIKWKHAMHLIRLLLSGITVLRDGFVPLKVDQHRDRLLAIRDGSESWEAVDAWRLELHKEFDAAFETTRLPDRPDYEAANAFLIRARRKSANPRATTRLIDRWIQLGEDLGLSVDHNELVSAGRTLIDMYSSDPRRTYHNAEHLAACLAELDTVRDMTNDPAGIAAAMWFHDAVYQPGAPNNEQQSADLAVETLGRLGMDSTRLEKVARLINATSHLDKPESYDEELICDIDLAVLGNPWSEYSRYAAAVRWEYSLPSEQYNDGRGTFLRNMLTRRNIYHTRRFGDNYEQTARENMQRELAELEE